MIFRICKNRINHSLFQELLYDDIRCTVITQTLTLKLLMS
jgi:hypothetical protein